MPSSSLSLHGLVRHMAEVELHGGLPEYLAVALMATRSGVPVLPHAGDMGQLHQHLAFFTRVALGLPELPLEMIPHLAEHFAEPCQVVAGRYQAPSARGASTTIRDESTRRYAAPGPAHVPGPGAG